MAAMCAAGCCTAAAAWIRCKAPLTVPSWKACTCGRFWTCAAPEKPPASPDAAVSGAHYQRICGMRYADGSEMDFSPAGIQRIAAEKAAYEAKAGHPVHDFYWFTDLYKQMPFGNPAYHELFRLLEEHRVPLLFHCTCGKDRTGIAAMLVLLALGVSREDAIADYMLTNVYRKAIIDKFMQDKPADQYDLLLPVEGVSESMGAGSIDVLLEKYPSYEAYFEAEYGLTTARLAALRDFYLE